jgi:hypothetical protein
MVYKISSRRSALGCHHLLPTVSALSASDSENLHRNDCGRIDIVMSHEHGSSDCRRIDWHVENREDDTSRETGSCRMMRAQLQCLVAITIDSTIAPYDKAWQQYLPNDYTVVPSSTPYRLQTSRCKITYDERPRNRPH